MPKNKRFTDKNQRGNAMIYILLALALFGFLTLTLSKQSNQSDSQDLSDELAKLYANELIEYVSSAQQAVDMMLSTGSEIDELSFVNPTSATFNTPPHIHKLFHSQGGGLNFQTNFNDKIQNGVGSAWVFKNDTNVEWTDSTANDVILSAYFIRREVCQEINRIITGNTAIPVTANPHANYFTSGGGTDFDSTECAACEGFHTLCVENDSNDNYTYYTIISGQ